MRQNPSMEPTERQMRVISLLEHNVLTEIEILDGMLDLGLSANSRDSLMRAITSGILYAFDLDWSPDWVKPGDVHTWEDDSAWLARCSICLSDSPKFGSKDSARRWALDHVASH